MVICNGRKKNMGNFDLIIESFRKQYNSMWQMCIEAITICDQSNWKREIDHNFFVPSRILLHITETVDYYLDEDPKNFPWGSIADVENCSSINLPTKKIIKDYIRRIKTKSFTWLTDRENRNINLPENIFNTDWETDIERAIYALRHSQHHLGQLSLDLQRRGLKEINWL